MHARIPPFQGWHPSISLTQSLTQGCAPSSLTQGYYIAGLSALIWTSFQSRPDYPLWEIHVDFLRLEAECAIFARRENSRFREVEMLGDVVACVERGVELLRCEGAAIF